MGGGEEPAIEAQQPVLDMQHRTREIESAEPVSLQQEERRDPVARDPHRRLQAKLRQHHRQTDAHQRHENHAHPAPTRKRERARQDHQVGEESADDPLGYAHDAMVTVETTGRKTGWQPVARPRAAVQPRDHTSAVVAAGIRRNSVTSMTSDTKTASLLRPDRIPRNIAWRAARLRLSWTGVADRRPAVRQRCCSSRRRRRPAG